MIPKLKRVGYVMEFTLFNWEDLLKCTETFVQVFNQEPWNDQWSMETAKQYLLDYINTPGFMGIVAVEGKEIIGFIFGAHKLWWSGGEFFINEMCVSIEKQNTGVGSKLLKYLMNELNIERVSNISLLTDRGIPAEAFYKKHGFTEINRLMFLTKEMK
ncbi:GNAT family N-acetyltransferase [Peribacillus muralis]|uniref:GNAT family N-acetyltransferase n=1 Tax=Peribacillus muralis TaxID=264697 RepID=UPI001F4F10C8|nr:GNAT family N-acetyltransferase [Peribacillus muralis]MCK1994988.1 GNAT family N-acetyltransferase [Peribacillus muralis]MCK2015641.1 GNAT family N-acetyltransferase [Peribacillus muralis]